MSYCYLVSAKSCLSQNYGLVNLKFLIIWASTRQNLFSGFPTKPVPDQSPQLQRLGRKVKFHMYQVYILYFEEVNNKGADQTVRMCRLV